MHTSDQLVANMQLQEPRLRELASGVDALYLSGRAELPKRFLARLEDCRAWAAEAKRPAPCEIGEHTFGIAPHGWGKYRFCLDHHMARIGFSTSRHLPTVRVQPRSEFLHAVGPGAAVATLREMLEPELGQLRLWVNRVDLFADWQGWTLSLDDAHRFVCRAEARRTYEVGGTLTGLEFGSRKTKTLLARLYDKTAETAAKDTGWWHEVWGERYVHGLPVHRLEFEFSRQGLVEFDLNTPDQVLGAAGDLWAYATGEWLTYRSPTADQTRSRWPLAPEWLQVQAATLGHRAVGARASAPGPAVDLHSEAAPGPDRLPGLARRPHRHGGHRRHAWEPSGIICTPTRSSVTRSLPTGWPAAAANWSCGEHGRARLRAGGGSARADRFAHGARGQGARRHSARRQGGTGGQRC